MTENVKNTRIVFTIALLAGVIALEIGFILFDWSTGFAGKTLWDWFELLIIPAVLTLGAYAANQINQRNEQRRADRDIQIEREIASDRNQEAILQAYLDRMTDLLLTQGLRASQPEDEVRTVADTRTLTALRSLNKERKETIIRFLAGAKLVTSKREPSDEADSEPDQPEYRTWDDPDPILDLSGADLDGVDLLGVVMDGTNLIGTSLRKANLYGIYLKRADLIFAKLGESCLQEADLRGARLSHAEMLGVDLRDANLAGAILEFADLAGAKLTGADLSRATMNGVNFEGAEVSVEQLWQAASLEGATMPDGSMYEDGIWFAKMEAQISAASE